MMYYEEEVKDLLRQKTKNEETLLFKEQVQMKV